MFVLRGVLLCDAAMWCTNRSAKDSLYCTLPPFMKLLLFGEHGAQKAREIMSWQPLSILHSLVVASLMLCATSATSSAPQHVLFSYALHTSMPGFSFGVLRP